MKTLIKLILLAGLLGSTLFAAEYRDPITRGVLLTPLDGNQKTITNLLSLTANTVTASMFNGGSFTGANFAGTFYGSVFGRGYGLYDIPWASISNPPGAVDTSSLASTGYVNTAVSGLSSTGYVNTAVSSLASTGYVNTAVTGLASTGYVNTAIGTLGTAGSNTFLPKVGTIPSTALAPDGAGIASTNYVNTVTNGMALSYYTTNSGTQAITFGSVIEYRDFSTNAAFAFTGFTGVSSTNMQTTVYFVTNSTASAWAVTPPAGMLATNGTWYVTNVTAFTFVNNGKKWTNGAAYPIK